MRVLRVIGLGFAGAIVVLVLAKFGAFQIQDPGAQQINEATNQRNWELERLLQDSCDGGDQEACYKLQQRQEKD